MDEWRPDELRLDELRVDELRPDELRLDELPALRTKKAKKEKNIKAHKQRTTSNIIVFEDRIHGFGGSGYGLLFIPRTFLIHLGPRLIPLASIDRG